jgi:hypothetical protein
MDKQKLREKMKLHDDHERVKNLAALLMAEIKMNHDKTGRNNFCDDELAILRAIYTIRQIFVEEEEFDMLALTSELNRVVVMDLISNDKVKNVILEKGKKNEAGS